MNINISKIAFGLCFGVAALTACDDPDEAPTSVDYDRLFSPTSVSTRIVNRTNVIVEWNTINTTGETFTIEFAQDSAFTNIVKTVEGITESPTDTIGSFEAETKYYLRISSAYESETSKWSPIANFKTEAKQIMLASVAGDIQATSVTLRWPAGTAIDVIRVCDGNETELYTREVSAEECANGVATVDGLTGETDYSFFIMNNGKTQGSLKVKTELDLQGAVGVSTMAELLATLESSEAGAVIALMPGTYAPADTSDMKSLTISKTVSLKSVKSDNKAIIKGVNFKVMNGASLDLTNLVIDGYRVVNSGNSDTIKTVVDGKEIWEIVGKNDTTMHADQAIIMAEAGNVDHVSVEGCEIRNFAKGTIYGNNEVVMNLVSFKNNVIHDIVCEGGDCFDFRKTGFSAFVFQNNTVYKCANTARDLFRMDAACATMVTSGAITITNNTFDNVSNNSGKRVLYIRLGAAFPITFKNNVVSNTAAYITNQSTTCLGQDAKVGDATVCYIKNQDLVSSNNYFKAPNMTASTTSNAVNDATNFTEVDPGYKADYTITNETLILNNVGNIQ